VGLTSLFTIIRTIATNVTALQSADSFEQVTRVLLEDGTVCVEACRRDLIIIQYIYIYIYIYSTVRVHLVGIFKIKFLHKK
jgi:hypothetical protein